MFTIQYNTFFSAKQVLLSKKAHTKKESRNGFPFENVLFAQSDQTAGVAFAASVLDDEDRVVAVRIIDGTKLQVKAVSLGKFKAVGVAREAELGVARLWNLGKVIKINPGE